MVVAVLTDLWWSSAGEQNWTDQITCHEMQTLAFKRVLWCTVAYDVHVSCLGLKLRALK